MRALIDMHSVETEPPPEQATPLISWTVWGGVIDLEPPVGDDPPVFWFTPDGGTREDGKLFGNVTYNADRQRWTANWNKFARMTIGRQDIENMDTPINYAMTRWSR